MLPPLKARLLPLLFLEMQLIPITLRGLLAKPSQGYPIRTSRCRSQEYLSAGLCCVLCPEGHYVKEPCRRPHTQGTCARCDRGTFMKFPNGLPSCQLCSTCSKGQVTVMNCTSTNDSICQCQPGFFFHHLGFDDACRPCSRCPKGEVALHGCNSTADTVCDKHIPVSERIHWYHLLAAILPTMLLAAIPYRYIMKQGCRGVPAACYCLHIGCSEGHGEGRKRMVLESPRPLESLHENGDTDSTVLSTGDVSSERLSEGSLDMGPEAPILPRTLEHWAGVDGPQAAAGEGVWTPHWSPPPDPSSSHWV